MSSSHRNSLEDFSHVWLVITNKLSVWQANIFSCVFVCLLVEGSFCDHYAWYHWSVIDHMGTPPHGHPKDSPLQNGDPETSDFTAPPFPYTKINFFHHFWSITWVNVENFWLPLKISSQNVEKSLRYLKFFNSLLKIWFNTIFWKRMCTPYIYFLAFGKTFSEWNILSFYWKA